MAHVEPPPAPDSASRRAVLKAAVGAGVGLAAWSAPKIGTIPAYALTNSSGVFNGTCYYVSFFRESFYGFTTAASWQQGSSTQPTANQGRSSNLVTSGTGYQPRTATFRWDGLFPDGSDLVVTATASVEFLGGSSGTLTLQTAPQGCEFAIPSATTATRTDGNYNADIPAGTCTPSGGNAGGTYTRLTATQINFSTAGGSSGQNHIIFNIVCN